LATTTTAAISLALVPTTINADKFHLPPLVSGSAASII